MDSYLETTEAVEMDIEEGINEVLPADGLINTSSYSQLSSHDYATDEGLGFTIGSDTARNVGVSDSDRDLFYLNNNDHALPVPTSFSAFIHAVDTKLSHPSLNNPNTISHVKLPEVLKNHYETCHQAQVLSASKTEKLIQAQRLEKEEIERMRAENEELKRQIQEKKDLLAFEERKMKTEIEAAKIKVDAWKVKLEAAKESRRKSEEKKKKAVKNYKKMKASLESALQARDQLNKWFDNHGITVCMVDDSDVAPSPTSSIERSSSSSSSNSPCPLLLQFTNILSDDPNKSFYVEFTSFEFPVGNFKIKAITPEFDGDYDLVEEANSSQDFITFIIACKRHWSKEFKIPPGGNGSTTATTTKPASIEADPSPSHNTVAAKVHTSPNATTSSMALFDSPPTPIGNHL